MNRNVIIGIIIIVIGIVLLGIIQYTQQYNVQKQKPDNSNLVSKKEEFKYDFGHIGLTTKELRKGRIVSKRITFKHPISNPSFMRTITRLDIGITSHIDVTVKDLSSTGCTVNFHLSKDLSKYWSISMNWFVHNNRGSVQTGQGSDDKLGSKAITKDIHVTFPRPYLTPPDVKLFLTGFNADDPSLKLIVQKVTKNGFTLKVHKWRNTNYHWFKFDWVAASKNDPVVKLSHYYKNCYPSTKKCSLINKGGLKKLRTLIYDPFKYKGSQRIIGISSIDAGSKNNLRLTLFKGDYGVKLRTWWDTTIWGVYTSHMEFIKR